MRLLPPAPLLEKYWLPIEKEIEQLFYEMFYEPVFDVLHENGLELRNDKLALAIVKAIAKGQVYFRDGLFWGRYNATITKEFRALSAKYNQPTNTWKLPQPLPPEIQIALAQFQLKTSSVTQQLVTAYDNTKVGLIVDNNSTLETKYYTATGEMAQGIDKTVRDFTIPPKFTLADQERISKQWATNLDLYIKTFSEQNILNLRSKVQVATLGGYRAGSLESVIQENYHTTKAKARFLARQETSLLMSKMRELRYRSIGCLDYQWLTSHDERVRHDHAKLNGKIFSWNSPPVTNRKTGARNNPGEDFGCRCLALPIIP